MSLSDADAAVIQQIVTDTVRAVLHEDGRLNGRLGFTEREAASMLGIAKHVLRDCRLRGEIAGFRAGRGVCYSREELLRFMSEQEIGN